MLALSLTLIPNSNPDPKTNPIPNLNSNPKMNPNANFNPYLTLTLMYPIPNPNPNPIPYSILSLGHLEAGRAWFFLCLCWAPDLFSIEFSS